MIVFEAEGLGKTYGRGRNLTTALSQVDLRLEEGRIYGLVGNNGAGKTTLMKLMAGLVLPTADSMSLFGARDPKGQQAARLQLGALISEASGYEDLSLWQNLRTQAILLPPSQRGDLRALCELVGLNRDSLRRTLRQASAGQKQRYGLAAALLGSPKLLLLDEPMNALDPGGVAEIRELLLRLNREKGITFLVSSHLLAELHKIATDYIFLRFGRVLETVTAEELDRRIEARGLRDAEAYFAELERSARAMETSLTRPEA